MTVHILVACILLFFALGGLSTHWWGQGNYWLPGIIASVVAILGFFFIMIGVIHI